ncbi:MAG TPA: hypothetical protein VKR53_05280 [Puia sp.]|nr:hypothetical protein [Puia sp.]
MKKIFTYIFFLSVGYDFSGCRFVDQRGINKIWMYGDEMSGADFDSCKLTPVSFLSLHPDGTYTKDFGSFEYGRWATDNRKIVLRDQKNEIRVYGIKYSWPDSLKLIARDGFVAGFEPQPFSFSSAAEDPFSLPNNRWRLPATHKESTKELSMRLANHCHFWEMYFTWALHDQIDYLDVRSTPTLLKVYGNGLVLKYFNDLPKQWIAYFFDEEDCRKANDMMQNIFVQHKIKMEKAANKYKMFISLFVQLQKLLE